MVGSLEFCTGKLGSRLIMVLGHTQCGAIAGATATHQAGGEVKAPGCALEGLLQGLASVAKEASDDLGPGVSQEKLVSHAVKVNVFNSMNFLLQFSEPIRELVRKGELDIQGGIYHLETGRVEFLGRSPRQDELLSSKLSFHPPWPWAWSAPRRMEPWNPRRGDTKSLKIIPKSATSDSLEIIF